MNRKRLLFIIPLSLLALALSACGGSPSADSSSLVLTEAALIYEQSLTQTAQAAPPTATPTEVPPTATNTPELPTLTPTVTGTPSTATPLPTQPPASGGGGGASLGCLRAELTYETIPDGTQMEISQSFSKRWVLKNVGTCPWTPAFAAIFVDGELMGAESVQGFEDYIDKDIYPGERIDMSIAMQAPNERGTYRGYWMLRSDSGTIFGLGPDGRGWFWVEIFAQD
ncbi:MAG: hypothetical protein KIS80_00325 [Anaerolineales bacterium]|nr:hypothetical protein [Anaerolineales bacterium]